MRYEYFGDSYDIVKRALVDWLRPLGRWSVQPLFTDDVSPEHAAAFARFVGAELIEPFRARTVTECRASLEACHSHANLLVDPDTGVALPQIGRRVPRTHLSAEVVQSLCLSNPDRVVVVFDQALRREAPEQSLRSKIAWLAANQVVASAFHSHASFLVCAAKGERVKTAVQLLLEAGLPTWRIIRETAS